jgi:hypothetical protein
MPDPKANVIASALGCTPQSLMPSKKEVLVAVGAGIRSVSMEKLA